MYQGKLIFLRFKNLKLKKNYKKFPLKPKASLAFQGAQRNKKNFLIVFAEQK